MSEAPSKPKSNRPPVWDPKLASHKSGIEKTADHFELAKIVSAREKTWDALRAIQLEIRPGMLEEDAYQLALAVISSKGADKNWHRAHVRFGSNTLRPFGVPSEPNTKLKSDDIYFIDIGPVWEGYEGDAGQTFVVGSDSEKARCVRDGQEIYQEVRSAWETKGLHGDSLYAFATEAAKARGWVLNLHESNGHRLSEFPHAVYFRGAIADLGFTPSPGLWVLEIQLRHPTLPYGSFYEDLLI